jgi:hypothetical protein
MHGEAPLAVIGAPAALVDRDGRMGQKREQPVADPDLPARHSQQGGVAAVTVEEHQARHAGPGQGGPEIVEYGQQGGSRQRDGPRRPEMLTRQRVGQHRQDGQSQVGPRLGHCFGDGIGHQGISDQRQVWAVVLDRADRLDAISPGPATPDAGPLWSAKWKAGMTRS